jgi:hypothetical protein
VGYWNIIIDVGIMVQSLELNNNTINLRGEDKNHYVVLNNREKRKIVVKKFRRKHLFWRLKACRNGLISPLIVKTCNSTSRVLEHYFCIPRMHIGPT